MKTFIKEGAFMIVVLNVYRIKFEKAEQAMTIWRENMLSRDYEHKNQITMRLLSDAVGTYFTLMVEVTAVSLEAYESWKKDFLGNRDNGDWYRRFTNLASGQYKEMFKVEETVIPVSLFTQPVYDKKQMQLF